MCKRGVWKVVPGFSLAGEGLNIAGKLSSGDFGARPSILNIGSSDIIASRRTSHNGESAASRVTTTLFAPLQWVM